MTTEAQLSRRHPIRVIPALAGLAALALVLLTDGTALAAQARVADVVMELEIERAELERALVDLEAAGSGGTADGAGERTRRLIELARLRLERGDFRAGDHVDLRVEGEPELTDTFTVATGPRGPRLSLPMVGDVELHGVLRSELEPRLHDEISRVIREPTVRARGLVRVSVLGEVATPGFYIVTPDALLADALMLAGGPTREARMSRLRVERSPESFWHPDLHPPGPAEVRSVNELGLQTGDRVVVPRGATFTRRDFITFSLMGLSVMVTAIAIL